MKNPLALHPTIMQMTTPLIATVGPKTLSAGLRLMSLGVSPRLTLYCRNEYSRKTTLNAIQQEDRVSSKCCCIDACSYQYEDSSSDSRTLREDIKRGRREDGMKDKRQREQHDVKEDEYDEEEEAGTTPTPAAAPTLL